MRFVPQRRPAFRRRNRNWIAKGKATHALAASAIATGAPSVGAPAFGQIHALAAISIASGAPSAGAPAIGQTHALSATEIASGAPNAGAPSFGGTPAPILIEAEGFDLSRADNRRRDYELRLRADLESAGRELRETETRPTGARGAPARKGEGPAGSGAGPSWLSAPFPTRVHWLSATRGEEDDEDVLLLTL